VTHDQSDMRSFLADADKAGVALHINKPVDVATEVAALCSETFRPTIFHNLKGFEGFRLVDGLTRTRETQALALGLDCPPNQVIPSYAARLAEGPGSVVQVNTSPAQEVVWENDDIKLSRLPIPVESEGMDLPHLGIEKADFRTPCISGGIVITKHPETGEQNTFFTMAQVVSDNRIHFFMLPGHTQENVEAWAARDERCPMAIVIGCHPAYEFGAAYTGPHDGFSELHIASRLLGAPVPLVKGKTVDLDLPANSEIIIEGFIDPDRQPYLHVSSHTDTHAPIFSREPFLDVTAITMRKDPIYRQIQPTRFTEHHSLAEFIGAPMVFMHLKSMGLEVHDVAMPLHGGGNLLVIQMTARAKAEVHAVLEAITSMTMAPRMTVIVDDDIDIYSAEDLLYAMAIRGDGSNALVTYTDDGRSYPEPLTALVNGPSGRFTPLPNNRWGMDATKPALDEPERRLEFSRLQARSEATVKLADFMD